MLASVETKSLIKEGERIVRQKQKLSFEYIFCTITLLANFMIKLAKPYSLPFSITTTLIDTRNDGMNDKLQNLHGVLSTLM